VNEHPESRFFEPIEGFLLGAVHFCPFGPHFFQAQLGFPHLAGIQQKDCAQQDY
jgi:hypothetical protein